MSTVSFLVTFLAYTLLTSGLAVAQNCKVTSYSELNAAVSQCTNIVISGITVPAGAAINIKLKDGATLTFEGVIMFEYKEWNGPFVRIEGNGITVQGASGHVLDGQGPKYWDGLGGNGGKTKPQFFTIRATDSVFKGIKLLNCPRNCVSIRQSHALTLSEWNLDSSAGDVGALGHNTDGFDISTTTDLLIENTVVRNQDDCVAINRGSDMQFRGLSCYGGHGLSLSVGKSQSEPTDNMVSNILFTNCSVYNSRNGIHVKTHADGTTGYIRNVTYSNIKLEGITYYGINIQEDYENGGSTGIPNGNVPITNLTMKSITGSMTGSHSVPVYILCGDGGCSSWTWSSISIRGNEKASSCNFNPSGFTC